MKKIRLLLLLSAVSLPLSATQIYSQNFESVSSVPLEWSSLGTEIASTGGLSAFGFGSQHLRAWGFGSPQAVLTLSGLAAHTSITLLFDVIAWDNMGSNRTFEVIVDGNTLSGYPVEMSNYSSLDPSGFTGPGVLVSGNAVDFGTPNYGFSANRDQGRSVGAITFAHAASTLTVKFAITSGNVNGGSTESWGLDNVVILDNNVPPPPGVPEPSTFALFAIGAGLGAYRLRRR